MAIEFFWRVLSLDIVSQLNGCENVVTTVNWVRVAKDENGNESVCAGTQTLPIPDLSNFVPYEQLSEELVCSWLDEHVLPEKISEIDQKLVSLSQKVAEEVVQLPLPWR